MEVQLDGMVGIIVKWYLQVWGIVVWMGIRVMRIDLDELGVVMVIEFQDGLFQCVDVVIFMVGMWVCDEFVWNVDIVVYLYGGIVVDEGCWMLDFVVLVIGEVVSFVGCCVGCFVFVYVMVDVVVGCFVGEMLLFVFFDEFVVVMLVGVEVVSFGDVFVWILDVVDVFYVDLVVGVYCKLVLVEDVYILLGGIFVGDVLVYGLFCQFVGVQLGVDFVFYVFLVCG